MREKIFVKLPEIDWEDLKDKIAIIYGYPNVHFDIAREIVDEEIEDFLIHVEYRFSEEIKPER